MLIISTATQRLVQANQQTISKDSDRKMADMPTRTSQEKTAKETNALMLTKGQRQTLKMDKQLTTLKVVQTTRVKLLTSLTWASRKET